MEILFNCILYGFLVSCMYVDAAGPLRKVGEGHCVQLGGLEHQAAIFDGGVYGVLCSTH